MIDICPQVDDARIVSRPFGACQVRSFSTMFKAAESDQCACVFDANYAKTHASPGVSADKDGLPSPSRAPNDVPEPNVIDAGALPWVERGTEPSITLLVSHMAIGRRDAPHYAEIEGAMRANLRNPALAELFVLYDSSPEDGCAELIARLTTHHSTASATTAKLSCYAREQELGQPRVRDLFRFATENWKRGGMEQDGEHIQRRRRRNGETLDTGAAGVSRGGGGGGDGGGDSFIGDIVILSNADIAFDCTLAAAPRLHPDLTSNDVLVFSVTGYPDVATYSHFVGNGNASDTADIAFQLSRKKAEFKPQVSTMQNTHCHAVTHTVVNALIEGTSVLP
jgi:hypothetical protein